MPEPTIEDIRIALAEAIVGSPTRVGRYFFDPFTYANDVEKLEAWAWGKGIHLDITCASCDKIVFVQAWGKDRSEADIRVRHNGTSADMLRARREAVCRAVFAAIQEDA